MQSLTEKYCDQRIHFIDEHFETLKKQHAEIITELNHTLDSLIWTLGYEGGIDEEAKRSIIESLNHSLTLINLIKDAITEYTCKVHFVIPPNQFEKSDKQFNALEALDFQQKELKYRAEKDNFRMEGDGTYTCIHHKNIINILNDLKYVLPRVEWHMVRCTQSQREQVFIDALNIFAHFNVKIDSNTQQANRAMNSHNLFAKK